MIILIDYASPSFLDASRESAEVGLATNARRPVRLVGRVAQRSNFVLRIALRALGEAIWSDDTWLADADILDPVITVHPDRIFFEAFSQDQSSYVTLIVDSEVFESSGQVITGTTNIDFTAWLWGALGEMRSSRDTTFRIGQEGLEVNTSNAGGRFEKKVELPDAWVRGFLQVQAAMGMPGTRIRVQPVDLLAAIRFLRFTKAKVSPRAMRYEFTPVEDARLVLEPWEEVIRLHGAEHHYTEPKTTRVWGRRRLRLIEGLLPFAEAVDVYLKGRALPSFYAVKLPGMTFVLGLTGWSGSSFTSTGGFDLLSAAAEADDELVDAAFELLKREVHASARGVSQLLKCNETQATKALVRLCRQGRCMFDIETREYRHRELFEQAADERLFFPPDLRQQLATQMLAANQVLIESCVAEETTKLKQLKTNAGKITREITYRDWRVTGIADHTGPVEVVINDNGQIVFGRCICEYFQENLLNCGPCGHMLAIYKASEPLRQDTTSSRAATGPLDQPTRQPSRWEVD